MDQFILYTRKSTDVEDKQVLSIEAQLTELRAYAKQERLEIVSELVEKQSAKLPGRPLFGDLLKRIEAGEATGILAWHPDRLARNSVDGGQLIYLLDTGRLTALKFPTFWFEPTPQGKFMLALAFGQSKYYVDALSENTKRGLRQKVRRGECPGRAPVGYINDVRIKSIVVDKRRAPIIVEAFELYAQNESRLEDVAAFLAQQGVTTRSGKSLSRDRITHILTNPFYYGHFRYGGEVHEGNHPPILTKQLFDRVQAVVKERGRPHRQSQNEPQAFCGLLRCGECGMGITAEVRVKRQKNGNEHRYTYYRCTKKSKTQRCGQPHIREEELDRQLSALLQSVALPPAWAAELRRMLKRDEAEASHSTAASARPTQEKIQAITVKLQRLLDGYLDQAIEREVYVAKKAELMSAKKSLEEQAVRQEQTERGWLEPLAQWIQRAEDTWTIAREHNLFAKKVVAKEIFGSNLRVAGRMARCSALVPLAPPWAAVRAAHGKVGKSSISFLLERVAGRSHMSVRRGTEPPAIGLPPSGLRVV